MHRIPPVDRDSGPRAAVELLAAVERHLGTIPNLISTMAHSPPVAEAYLGFSGALARGSLPARSREQIALLVGEANGCDYCLAAHTALGRGAGLSREETLDARRGGAADTKERAALEFGRRVVARRGDVSDADVDRVRAAGYSDGEIGEIVAHVALNIFTNYFNLVARTELDFPPAPALSENGRALAGEAS